MKFYSHVKHKKSLVTISFLVITWTLIISGHEHDTIQAAELSNSQPQREVFYNLNENSVKLKNLDIQPNEIVDLLIKDHRNEQHAFIFTGMGRAQYDVISFENGVYRIRLRAPEKGNLLFYCTIQGHENAHGIIQVQSVAK